jgi:hypothetical protein
MERSADVAVFDCEHPFCTVCSNTLLCAVGSVTLCCPTCRGAISFFVPVVALQRKSEQLRAKFARASQV